MLCGKSDEIMPLIILTYIRWIDAMNRFIGRIAMYLIFALVGVLLWSSISKTFFTPSLWTLETAQFVMVAYYVIGGPYSIQLGSNVRMDLFYGDWSVKRKAQVDAFTVFFLLFYLGVLFYGAVGSTAYSLGYFGTEPFVFFGDLALGFLTAVLKLPARSLAILSEARQPGALISGQSSFSCVSAFCSCCRWLLSCFAIWRGSGGEDRCRMR